MPTPMFKLTTAQAVALESTTLGNLKPYQLDQVQDLLARFKWEQGSNADVSVQATITTIFAGLTNNP
jgi:hypothetical protein